jgi:hypothetical protein
VVLAVERDELKNELALLKGELGIKNNQIGHNSNIIGDLQAVNSKF